MITMARSVMLSDEVYEALKMAKLPGESFSDVIRRLLRMSKPRISELAGKGTFSKKEWSKIVKAFEAQRKLDDIRRSLLLEMVEKD